MSYKQKFDDERLSPGAIADVKDKPLTIEPLPFVSERGSRLDKSNPFAILEPVVNAASEPSLRMYGTKHFAERFRSPDGVRNANRVLRTQLEPELAKLARAAGGATELPNKDNLMRAFASSHVVFSLSSDLGERARRTLEEMAERLQLGNLQTVNSQHGKRGGRG